MTVQQLLKKLYTFDLNAEVWSPSGRIEVLWRGEDGHVILADREEAQHMAYHAMQRVETIRSAIGPHSEEEWVGGFHIEIPAEESTPAEGPAA